MALMLLRPAPGVQRDGTTLDSTSWTDAQWCRWQRGLPRKMGGYKNTQPYLNAVSRALYSQAQDGYRYISSGTPSGVDSFTIDNTGVASAVADPAIPTTTHPTTTGLPTAVDTRGNSYLQTNSWQFESQYDNASSGMLLFALCAQNTLDPSSVENFPLYVTSVYNPVTWTQGVITVGPVITPTARTGFQQVAGYGTGSDGWGGTQQALFPNGISGGICSLAPYLTIYGNDGFVAWSTPGYPTDFLGLVLGAQYVGATRVTNKKIIKGLPLRGGGGYSPAGLYWSLDSVVRATFVGVTNGTFQFDQITTQSSIMSDKSVIENDGTYYWAGVDRFLMYNGVVQEIPNSQNVNWFFDGINQNYSGKTFVMKIPRYGEIWWCYPRGTNTECSHAVIYNYRERTWYDTALPPDLRSSGLYVDNFIDNIMGSPTPYTYNTLDSGGSPIISTAYNMWRHEQGTDQIYIQEAQQNAVESYCTTPYFSGVNAQTQSSQITTGVTDANVHIGLILPDMIQSGDMTVTALKKNNPKAPEVTGTTGTIYANPATPQQQVTPMKDTAKYIRLKFDSNVIGGDYQMGRTTIELDTDGERST